MVISPLTEFLEKQGWIILDGALATELEWRGADLDDPLWSAKVLLERPDLIRQVHYDYYLAGADVATAASYQASFEGFARLGIDRERAKAIFQLSVSLALEARDEFWAAPERREGRIRPFVVASVGPYGAFLADGSEYRGDYDLSEKELAEWHRPRLAELVHSQADMLAFETIPCLKEARALVRLLRSFPGSVAWLGFSCRDGERLCSGEPFIDAVKLAESCAQVVAVGVNCTPPQWVESLLRAATDYTSKALVAYPNSGEIWDAAGHCWLGSPKPVDFGIMARRWYRAGARLIGGCCRTRPEDVGAVRRELDDSWIG